MWRGRTNPPSIRKGLSPQPINLRAPRVQIEYDVELYGAEKKVELPFVMGVMADLSGNPTEAAAAVERYREAGAVSPCIGAVPRTDFDLTLKSLAGLAGS